jgi:Xaa-Pro dipeptidase
LGKRIGIELRTFGLTADKYDRVRRRLEGWCELVDATHVKRTLRLVKSPAEIANVRRAAELADKSLEAMLADAKPGAFEGAIAAAGAVPILAGGGDPTPRSKHAQGGARCAGSDDRGSKARPAARGDRRCAPPCLRCGGVWGCAHGARGYSLGALYRPTWMDVPPMLYSGNPLPASPGMVLFLHAILVDAVATSRCHSGTL